MCRPFGKTESTLPLHNKFHPIRLPKIIQQINLLCTRPAYSAGGTSALNIVRLPYDVVSMVAPIMITVPGVAFSQSTINAEPMPGW